MPLLLTGVGRAPEVPSSGGGPSVSAATLAESAFNSGTGGGSDSALRVYFSEAMTKDPGSPGFTIVGSHDSLFGSGNAASSVSGNHSDKWVFSATRGSGNLPFVVGETLTLSYSPGTMKTDDDGTPLDAFSGFSMTNYSAKNAILSVADSSGDLDCTFAAAHGFSGTERLRLTGSTSGLYDNEFGTIVSLPSSTRAVIHTQGGFVSDAGSYYNILGASDIFTIVEDSGIATVTTGTAHGLSSNSLVTISGSDSGTFDGTWLVTVTGTDTYTIPASASDGTYYGGSWSLVADPNHAIASLTDDGSGNVLVTPYGSAGLTGSETVTIQGTSGGTYNGTWTVLSGDGTTFVIDATYSVDDGGGYWS